MTARASRPLALLAACLIACLALAATSRGGEQPAPHVDRLLHRARVAVVSTPDLQGGWTERLVERDATLVRSLARSLASTGPYRGQPAGWEHSLRVELRSPEAQPVFVYVMTSAECRRGAAFVSVEPPAGLRGGGERLLPTAVARAWAPLLARAEAAPKAPAPDLSGTWEGQVLFSDGQRARAALRLEAGKGGWRGRYELRVLDEEGPGEPQGAPAQARLSGPGQVRLTLHGRVVQATLANADPHAEQALYGSFKSPRGEGVFMLYRYRQR